MRVSRDLYWDTIRRAANGDRRAVTEIGAFDILDALKWTQGQREVPSFGLRLDDLMWDFGVLANKAAEDDIEVFADLGHVPQRAPFDTYSIPEDQYWDAVRDVAKHAQKRAEKLDWPNPPSEAELEVAWGEQLFELLDTHPFSSNYNRALDVLRHTQNLEAALRGPDWAEEKDIIVDDWKNKNRKDAITWLSQIAMWEDAHRIWTSAGAGYLPNVRPDAYWDEVRKLERSLPYPINFTRDVGQVRFITDYHDALDVLRLSYEPGAMSNVSWLARLPIQSVAQLPWESAAHKTITVVDVLQAAARAAALQDAEYLGAMRHPYASKAPARITLDQYRAYVVSGARYLAAHPGQTPFESFFDATPTGSVAGAGHPLLAWTHNQSEFPYRALDVLYHTDRLEAVWDDRHRRDGYAAAVYRREYDQFDEYEIAASEDNLEQAVLWIASAAFCADVLDKLGGLSLSPTFTPNIKPNVYWDSVRQLSVRVHYPVDYENDQRLVTFISNYDDALDAIRVSSEPGMIGPFLNSIGVFKDPVDGTIFGALLGEPDREWTVEELVIVAAKLDAVTDADYWGAHRAPYPTKAPPLMSLDEYLDYVHTAAVAIARDPYPAAAFGRMLQVPTSVTRTLQAHPLLAVTGPRRAATFPFRTLDVLQHTQHREAIWEGALRRLYFIQGSTAGGPPGITDLWKQGFNEACRKSSTEEAFAWMASAAFGEDILDELSVMGLSKYAPNEVG